MYLSSQKFVPLGDSADLLSQVSTPIDTGSGISLSPLWIGGLGLLALAFAMSRGKKAVGKVRRYQQSRQRRRDRIAAAKEQLRAAKAD